MKIETAVKRLRERLIAGICDDVDRKAVETLLAGYERLAGSTEPAPSRFTAFNPFERAILLTLLQEHCNSVSQISVATETRTSIYLSGIEELEAECGRAG